MYIPRAVARQLWLKFPGQFCRGIAMKHRRAPGKRKQSDPQCTVARRKGSQAMGLCLGNQQLIEANLIRNAGANELAWLDELVD
jgi:hypothetical protein